MTDELELYDLTIVGGGPAGLFATFYSGMRNMKTKLIEASDHLGGKLNSYPEKMIWDVGGMPPLPSKQLIKQLIDQSKTFNPTIVLNQQIQHIERTNKGNLIIRSHTGEQHHTRTVLLSVGYGVPKPLKLDVEGAKEYEETNLHYAVTDIEQYRDKRVVISGGGDSAVDWANELEGVAQKVTIVHRRNQFGGHEHSIQKMKNSTIDVKTPYVINEINGTKTHIHSVKIDEIDASGMPLNHSEYVEVDAVIVNHGMQGDMSDIRNWGLEMDQRHVLVNDKLETSITGVYAAGDTAKFSNKINLLAGAFTDAAVAVNHAKTHLKPEAANEIFISSHNPIFKEKNRALGVSEVNV
ncbi:NAD(P)/FAD-dependent oxidoreductase [Bacillus sp. JCM 19041]|uniref:NAD(P)/FAD-dependent oxidoreductase n=1 Tax=Bacillus sp. JCM 19041 TaxID=1460637 RepID=UPI0006D19E26